MKKIRCILVDDEPLAIALLQKHIEQLDFMEVAGTCPNALKALETLKKAEVDLMFLDIRMPAINGMDFLRMLRNPPKVIITTAYREYALDGYDLDIIDYLLKPITFERFFKAIERYLRNANVAILPAPDEPSAIYVKSGHRTVRINTSDMLYLESLKDYVKIVTTSETITAKYRISDMEAELSNKGFLRIHRSFIVNLKYISAFTANDVEIGKIELPIGDSYKAMVTKLLKGS
ncbi:DNA-binding response regulator [Mucilaginibacter sp. PPCGB 2223]|uniref:LytR/AlgR family response regulator transcription factor n=1 Tax=Mucilaginibacter sp. PPCGB 2223 TaxID=1886027 RepID=UPI00082626ED|nr:LytTR family DNA-binding domain-containing protein [Mucilaginibacter sp. PPCGB 2223]OCX53725.1 DNA-binding response regulator [Mucilaginibacter sp. PPCGB 2223]